MNEEFTEHKSSRVHFFTDEEGRMHGKCTRWFGDGNLDTESFYIHGELDGEYKEWYHNGNIADHAQMKDGYTNGESKGWNSNGKLINHTYTVGNVISVDLLSKDLSDEDKFEITLTYGGKWLP